jgi:hypothetical protein
MWMLHTKVGVNPNSLPILVLTYIYLVGFFAKLYTHPTLMFIIVGW